MKSLLGLDESGVNVQQQRPRILVALPPTNEAALEVLQQTLRTLAVDGDELRLSTCLCLDKHQSNGLVIMAYRRLQRLIAPLLQSIANAEPCQSVAFVGSAQASNTSRWPT
ncbi:hypothetical protein WJX73_003761 [Symbiochloris irregularis]|uniref:Uncharacterized protein n=1 Tax=Symbiochloris irregularis TaxID=706552 RepID=A0AAW1PJ32_9CHLO